VFISHFQDKYDEASEKTEKEKAALEDSSFDVLENDFQEVRLSLHWRELFTTNSPAGFTMNKFKALPRADNANVDDVFHDWVLVVFEKGQKVSQHDSPNSLDEF